MSAVLAALPLTAVWAAGVGAWALAHRAHLRGVHSIDRRVLVGGTRGKTTMVKLMTHAMRLAGQQVCARTTGRRPEETLEGEALESVIGWRPSPRVAEPDVDEARRWMGVVRRQIRPDAVVLENAGVTPETLAAFGRHIFPPTLAVITDCKRDHLDQWPASAEDIASLHLSALRPGVAVVTKDETVAAEARAKRIKVHLAEEEGGTLPNWMKSHVATACAAMRTMGMTLSTEAKANLVAYAETLLPRPVQFSGGWFLDLFDANDPLSAARALSSVEAPSKVQRRVALFAHRHDRVWRWRAFQPWLSEAFDEVVRFDRWPSAEVTKALNGSETLFVGLGNAVGPAQALLAHVGRA